MQMMRQILKASKEIRVLDEHFTYVNSLLFLRKNPNKFFLLDEKEYFLPQP